MISTASFFFGRTRMGRTLGEGVLCAAVLLVRLAPPLPALHPGKRGGIIYSDNVPCSFAAHHGDSVSVPTSILPRQADEP